jgi:hypothetical protein
MLLFVYKIVYKLIFILTLCIKNRTYHEIFFYKNIHILLKFINNRLNKDMKY